MMIRYAIRYYDMLQYTLLYYTTRYDATRPRPSSCTLCSLAETPSMTSRRARTGRRVPSKLSVFLNWLHFIINWL